MTDSTITSTFTSADELNGFWRGAPATEDFDKYDVALITDSRGRDHVIWFPKDITVCRFLSCFAVLAGGSATIKRFELDR